MTALIVIVILAGWAALAVLAISIFGADNDPHS